MWSLEAWPWILTELHNYIRVEIDINDINQTSPFTRIEEAFLIAFLYIYLWIYLRAIVFRLKVERANIDDGMTTYRWPFAYVFHTWFVPHIMIYG